MTEQQERERIMRAMWAEMDRQCAIGAGEWHTDAETGLMCIKADFDPIAMAAALTPKAPPQTPPDAGSGSDGAGEREAEDAKRAIENRLTGLWSWLESISTCDWSEIVADGGITAGMVVQQEASGQRDKVQSIIEQVQRFPAVRPAATQPGDGGRS